MSKADIVLIILALLGAWGGYKEGFLMELISLAAVIIGVFCGFKLMGEGMLFLGERFNVDRSTLPYLSFVVIFVLVMLLVRMLGKLVKGSIDHSFLGTLDKAMGAVLGAFRTLFLLSIVVWILDSLKFSPKSEWISDSWLYPFTVRLAPSVANWLGQFLPVFKEIFRQF